MATGVLSFPFERLRGRENFDVWKRHAKSYLVIKNCWRVTETGVNAEDTKLRDTDERALAEITLMVEPCNFGHIANATSAKEAWDSLISAYEDSGLTRKVELLKKLVQFSCMQDYVNEMVMTTIKVRNAELSIDDEVVASLMLAGLPNDYQALVMAIENSKEKLTVDCVKSLLLQDTKFDNTNDSASNALYTKKSKAKSIANTKHSYKKRFRCYGCGQHGHMRKECTNRAENVERPKPSNSLLASVCMHSKHNENVWYIDSGATSHMTNNRNLLIDEKQSQNKEVIFANKERVKIESIGNVKLVLNGNKNKQSTNVENVEYVPNLCANLLSVRQMTNKGKKVVFAGDNCKIYDQCGKLIATAHVENDLYRLDCETVSAAKVMTAVDSYELWHRRLGHICSKNVNNVKNSSIGVNYSGSGDENCIVCAKGKQTRKISKEPGVRAKNLLDLVHSDVMGPFNTNSCSCAKYLLLFTDDYSRKVIPFPILRKSDVLEKFKNFKSLVENQCGRKIKILRTDNGTEYCNAQFSSYLQKCGIMHQKTAPYTPEQNGVAERMNRTLTERVRCMLVDSGLDNIFWAEAANTAAYIINRVPCRGSSKSPEELWSGVKPNMKNLRIFGCTALVHIPKQKRTKLDPKSEECIFVGYSDETKAYRLYRKSDLVGLEGVDVLCDNDPEGINLSCSNKIVEGDDALRDCNNSEGDVDKELLESEQLDSDYEGDFDTPCSTSSDHLEEAADTEANVRRSKRIASKASKKVVLCTETCVGDPVTYDEAIKSSESNNWVNAMHEEMKSLKSNKTWYLTNLPADKTAIASKWVYKTKRDANGLLVRRKARLVVKGCSQKEGVDYTETFAPVVRYTSIRFLFAMAAKYDLYVHQLDAVTAFLNGELHEEVYMKQPEGFEDGTGRVCRLVKSIYGLKQASRIWNEQLNAILVNLDLKRSEVDQCIYFNVSKNRMIFVAIYVDDVLIFSNDEKTTQQIKRELSLKFKMKDMGMASSVLGMRIRRNELNKTYTIDPSEYIASVLKRFGMEDCNPISTPIDIGQKLTKDLCPQNHEAEKEMKNVPYMEAIGSLLYCAQNTRPDICYAVNLLSRFSQNPGQAHWMAVKRIMRYLKGTLNKGIIYTHHSEGLVGYCVSDWAADVDERRSTSGYVFTMQGGPVSWATQRQRTVALSSTEAELMSIVGAIKELMWLRRLRAEFVSSCNEVTTLY